MRFRLGGNQHNRTLGTPDRGCCLALPWNNRDTRSIAARAFSLLELMIVLVIIMVITVLLDSEFTTTHKNRALFTCQKNLQTMYLALNIYQNDNGGSFPMWKDATSPAEPLSLLVPKSTTVTEIFICPGSKDQPLPEAESFAGRKISYAYYMGWATNDTGAILVSDAQVSVAPKNRGQAIFSDDGHAPGNNHGKSGGNLMAVGGEVTSSAPAASRDVLYPATVHMLNPE
jgi:type II secretory pathway pseudopilin PulG